MPGRNQNHCFPLTYISHMDPLTQNKYQLKSIEICWRNDYQHELTSTSFFDTSVA